MLPTLFHIPNQIGPVPFLKPQDGDYGFGLLLLIAVVCGGVTLFYKFRRRGADADFLVSLAILAAVCLAIIFVVPRLVDDVGLPIRGYGMMLLVAVVAGVLLAMWRARQVGANPEIILSMMFLIFVGGLVGARGLYVIQYWENFRPESWAFADVREMLWGIVNMTKGGLVVFGSLLGAAVAFGWYVWRYKLPPLALADIVVASLLLGQGLGRIGCLFNGCCYGGVCEVDNLPTITFPYASPAYRQQVEEGKRYAHGLLLKSGPKDRVLVAAVQPGSPAEAAGIRPGDRVVEVIGKPKASNDAKTRKFTLAVAYEELFAADGGANRDRVRIWLAGTAAPVEKSWKVQSANLPSSQPVHPTQIYGAVNGLVMCLFAWCYFPFRRRDGEVFAVMLSIFPFSRFFMEWIRTDEPQNWLWGMTLSQTIGVGLLLSSVPFWYFVLRQPKESKLAPDDWSKYNAHWAAETKQVSGE